MVSDALHDVPIILVSKKRSGSFISFIRKSEMSDMLMRVFMWSNIQLRMNSTESRETETTSWAVRISVIKPGFPSRIPTSTNDCVRKGISAARGSQPTSPGVSERFVFYRATDT